jgi:hypothetical protein
MSPMQAKLPKPNGLNVTGMSIILENVPNAQTLVKLVMYFQVHKHGI